MENPSKILAVWTCKQTAVGYVPGTKSWAKSGSEQRSQEVLLSRGKRDCSAASIAEFSYIVSLITLGIRQVDGN
jgi:hypothetical protein